MACKAKDGGKVSRRGEPSAEWYKDGKPQYYCYGYVDKMSDELLQECKIGDKIYQTDGVQIYESTIGEITVTTKHTIFVTENIAFDERAIGETIFLSYSEAEAHSHKPPKGE